MSNQTPIWMQMTDEQRRLAMALRTAHANAMDTCPHAVVPANCFSCLTLASQMVLRFTPEQIGEEIARYLEIAAS